ncbi:MAG: hypothetical protein Fur0020_13810 [Thermodesulfovibrionia bacterium]
MFGSIRRSFKEGLNKVKWIASFLAERIVAETAVARLLYESSKFEERIDELYRDIGKRVFELSDKGRGAFSRDFVIQQAIDEIKRLNATIKDYKEKAGELSRPPE